MHYKNIYILIRAAVGFRFQPKEPHHHLQFIPKEILGVDSVVLAQKRPNLPHNLSVATFIAHHLLGFLLLPLTCFVLSAHTCLL